MTSRRLTAAIFVLVLLGAALARFPRAEEGLPYIHHWDETIIATSALEMLKTGDLNPHIFDYGSVTIYAALGCDIAHYYSLAGRSRETGSPLPRLDEIRTEKETGWEWEISHPSFYRWNRWMVSLFGLGTIAACFFIARALAGEWAGLASAALLAGLEMHAQHSAWVTPDVPMSFFVVLAALLTVLFLDRGRPGFLVAAFASCGLAASTKYNSAPALLAPLAALGASAFTRAPGYRHWLWVAAVVVPAAAFLAGTPYALLDLPKFAADTAFDIYHYRTGLGQTEIEGGADNLMIQGRAFLQNLGYLGAGVSFAGLVVLLSGAAGRLFLVFPAVYLLLTASTRVPNHRNFLVLYPFIAVAFGCGAVVVLKRLRSLKERTAPASSFLASARRWAAPLFAALVIVLCLWGVAAAGWEARRQSLSRETRSVAIDRAADLVKARSGGSAKIGLAGELRFHREDLERLPGPYTIRPMKDLLCEGAVDFDLILASRKHYGYSDEAKARALDLDSAVPSGPAIIDMIGINGVYLDIFTINPAVLILDPAILAETATEACPVKVRPDDLLMSGDYPVGAEGVIGIYSNGTISTPPLPVGTGGYEFRFTASGTPAFGRFPRVRAAVLASAGEEGAAGAERWAEETFETSAAPEVKSIRFSFPASGQALLRIDFDDDAEDRPRREDRNLFVGGFTLVRLPGPEAAPAR